MPAESRAARILALVCILSAADCLIPSPFAVPGKVLSRNEGLLSRPLAARKFKLVPAMAIGTATGLSGKALVARASAASQVAASGSLALALSKLMGYGMLAGSLFLQAPQIIKIVASKSVLGISRASRYSEVPINSSACIYHILMKLPFSTWGENFAVLIQNLTIVGLVWLWEAPRVKWTEMVAVTLGFAALCFLQFSLPAALYPWLIYINLPLGVSSNLPQIVTNFRQKHTGQVAVVSNILKLVGCSVRIFTTLTQIGWDLGLISNYALGATMNLIIVCQCWIYREQTQKVLELEKAANVINE